MRWKTLREALWILIPLGVIGTWVGRRNCAAGSLFAGLIAFTLYFFRDPERDIPHDTDAVVAPADGKVVEVSEVPGEDGPRKRVGIFLSVFDVHVNRAPISGVITMSAETKGEFLDARNPESSVRNARRVWVFEGAKASVVVRQITGAIARRIVPWSRVGEFVCKGDRFGMIRFGSRTEIDLPHSTEILCKVGDVVKGGETVIAKLPAA